MQNTRLNTIFDSIFARLNQWLLNPWRRTSVQIISLLFGFFLGEFIASVAGQRADLDVTVAAVLVVFTEGYSWFFYRGDRSRRRSLLGGSLNLVKIGLIYSMFLESFKLGS
ncbi:MAG: DUF565 domain-containing protein [Oscillatoria sp. SIO1A7]|nr:DUF565 domain-containing protein [Oscillatoria sp. SIO1A7]